MKLKLTYINEETGVKFVIKNKGPLVYYQNSDVHDPKEFEPLTGQLFNGNQIERDLIETFYGLAERYYE
jgi:hypothetical protein